MFGFDKNRIIAAIVKVLNSNLDYIAERNGYFTTDDIEDIETWYIGIRVCFKRGTFRRYLMVSKTKVCAKLAPSRQEATFHKTGNQVSDRLHLSTYCYRWDDVSTWHTWTVSIGYSSAAEARAMQHWLWENRLCAHSIVRDKHRTNCAFELKVWGLDSDTLDKLMNKDKDWHEECRQQVSKLGKVNKYNYKPKGWQTEHSLPQPQKRIPIRVIKPNGAYRFMQGENMLVAVYTKEEVAITVKQYLMDDYEVEFEDSTTGTIYKAIIDGGKIKYKPVLKSA